MYFLSEFEPPTPEVRLKDTGVHMIYVIAVVIAALCMSISYITLDKALSDKTIILRPKDSEESNKVISAKQRYIISIGIFAVTVVASVLLVTGNVDWLGILKMSIGLVCLSGAACNDYRDHRIPNIFSLIIAVSAIACLCIGYFTSQEGATAYIFSSVFAAVVVVIFMTVASLLTKHGIGMGDIKLLTALALLGGVNTIGWTLIFGVAVCAAAAIFFLITKKKTVKETMPFGPFIFIGYIITIILNKF